MNDNFNELKNKVKKFVKKSIKCAVLIPIIIIIIISAIVYYITLGDATYEASVSNPLYATSKYMDSTSIGTDGKLSSSITAQELWDEMIKNDNRALFYLDTPEELLKLMNAELVTQYLDTRDNPDENIDWNADELNDVNSKNIQGIVKLKRENEYGKNSTMRYVDQETFQRYIDNYNSSGSESDKELALSHFTLERTTSTSNFGQAPITAGTTIKIPTGLGAIHTYMGWQKITSTTSTQYKLREKAGMNFDEEGFGKINSRYVIACTTTYGTVGDYIDFYQEDGTIIPCIIGDIKSQNDSGCNKWGHLDGHCIIEFVVDKETWYNPMHINPGNTRMSSRVE